jgi:hypothetical protein
VVLGALLGAAVVLAGVGVGYVVWGDDDEPTGQAAADLSDPPETDEGTEGSGDLGDDLSDLFGDDFSDLLGDFSDFLPEDFDDLMSDGFEVGEIQASIVFEPGTAEEVASPIEEAWADEPTLSGVLLVDPSDLPGSEGLPPGATPLVLTAFADEEDAEEVRRFVCGFVDEPAVLAVQLFGTEPCDQSA